MTGRPRSGWRVGPVRPESALLPVAHDPLRIGARTFRYRWPRTRRLLMREFRLSNTQAWTVAFRAHKSRGVASARMTSRLAWLGIAAAVSPAVVVFAAVPIVEAFIGSTTPRGGSGPMLAWAVGLSSLVAAAALSVWLAFERLVEDRLVDRQIRSCWRDQRCLWCDHDMQDASPAGDRWASCSECGMRSPVAVRTP